MLNSGILYHSNENFYFCWKDIYCWMLCCCITIIWQNYHNGKDALATFKH